MAMSIYFRCLVRLFCLVLIFSISTESFAAARFNLFEREKQNINQLSEFIYGDEIQERLAPVYLLGAVRKPGLYHVPPKTSLTTLLAIAGGPTEESNIEDILIRNEESKRLDRVDYKKILADSEQRSPVLAPRDVVLVGAREPTISNNTVVVITVVSAVVGLVFTGLLIKKSL
jgi:hypothetical protein